MGVYQGILLTPTTPNTVPGVDKIIQFLEWLVINADLELPSKEESLLLKLGLDPNGKERPKEEYKLVVVRNKINGTIHFVPRRLAKKYKLPSAEGWLEKMLNGATSWSLFSFDDKAFSRRLFGEAVGALSQNLTVFITEADSEAIVSSIHTNKANLRQEADHWWTDFKYPDRDFFIIFHTQIRGGKGDYFSLAWSKLNNTGVLTQMEQVLGVSLEGFPYLG